MSALRLLFKVGGNAMEIGEFVQLQDVVPRPLGESAAGWVRQSSLLVQHLSTTHQKHIFLQIDFTLSLQDAHGHVKGKE